MDAVGVNTTEPEQNEKMGSSGEICRFCLLINVSMRDLFMENDADCESLSTKAMSFTTVKMTARDGLPPRVCCECAGKLESAYEFKLQVEQADSVLRESRDSINIKAEFFNDTIDEMHNDDDDYDAADDSMDHDSVDEEIPDEDKEMGEEENDKDNDEDQESIIAPVRTVVPDENVEKKTKLGSELEGNLGDNNDKDAENVMECENTVKAITSLKPTECEPSTSAETNEEEKRGAEMSKETIPSGQEVNNDQTEKNKAGTIVQPEVSEDKENNPNKVSKNDNSAEKPAGADRDSVEENYFENLNLRLKKVESDNKNEAEKLFLCYICDKQFISKNILKEHMHSHEEVRRALSLKNKTEKEMPPKTPLKSIATTSTPQKANSSGKKPNRCPYCGKEYLYMISYNKHLKQHEKEKDEMSVAMPLEVSIHEDDRCLNFGEGDEAKDDDFGNYNSQNKRWSEQELKCPDCSMTFSQKNALVSHMMNSHSDTKYHCKTCDEEFVRKDQLVRHMEEHTNPHKRAKRGAAKQAQKIIDLISHEGHFIYDDDDKDDEYLLYKPKKDTSKKNTPAAKKVSPKQTVKSEPKQDNTLDKSKLDESDFDDDAPDSPEFESGLDWSMNTYECPTCGKRYNNKKSLGRHQLLHDTPNFECDICDMKCYRKDKFNIHYARCSKKHPKKAKRCTVCFEMFESYGVMIEHKAKHADEKTEEGERPKRESVLKKMKQEFECATCNRKLSSKQALKNHMELHNKDDSVTKSDKSDDSKKEDNDSDDDGDDDWKIDVSNTNYECTICKKNYSTKKSLQRHQLLHEEPQFSCDICPLRFHRKDKLQDHYERCSEKYPDQVRRCNICNEVFETNVLMKEHREKHITEGIVTEQTLRDLEPSAPFEKPGVKTKKRRTDIVGNKCPECGKQYNSRKNLLRHVQAHQGKKYLCDQCPKKFFRKEHLKIHQARHNVVKPFKCDKCTKAFVREEQLNNHLARHDGNGKKKPPSDGTKRFLCEICSKSFTQSTTLVAHLRAHSGVKPFVCKVCTRAFTTKQYLKMHMRTHTQERPYMCQYCSKAFARSDTLKNHLTSHTGEAKYRCKYCPKLFRRLKNLKEHIFIHTGQRPYPCHTCGRRFNNNGSRYAHSKKCRQEFPQNPNPRSQVQQTVQSMAQSMAQSISILQNQNRNPNLATIGASLTTLGATINLLTQL